MDKIILKGLEFYGHHGVLPEEISLGQKFIIDVELLLDLEKACSSDQLEHTISYAEIFEIIKETVEGQPRKLLEKIAGDIANDILKRFSVNEVRIKVKKPSAPVSGHFEYMAVEITRRGSISC